MNKEQQFNKGHITEGCDRCHVIMVMIDEFLCEHPAVKEAECKEDIGRAQDYLMSAYQKIGGLDE